MWMILTYSLDPGYVVGVFHIYFSFNMLTVISEWSLYVPYLNLKIDIKLDILPMRPF